MGRPAGGSMGRAASPMDGGWPARTAGCSTADCRRWDVAAGICSTGLRVHPRDTPGRASSRSVVVRRPRHVSGSNSVTVTVEWKDAEIAIGETTIFSGDKVTLKTA